jgi:multidrug efflux pump subunit AcrB
LNSSSNILDVDKTNRSSWFSQYFAFGRTRKPTQIKGADGDGDGIISKYFRKIIFKTLKYRILIIIFFIWLLGIPLWLLPDKIDTPIISNFYNNTIGSEFFQEKKELFYKIFGGTWNIFRSNVSQGDFFNYSFGNTYLGVSLESQQGTDIRVLDDITRKVENLLKAYSEYLTTFTTTVSTEYSYMRINFKKEYENSVIPLVLKSNLSSYFTEFGGVHASVIGYGQPFSSGGSFYESSSQSVQILGYNYLKVKELALEFKDKIEKNPRVENVNTDRGRWGRNYYEFLVEVNRRKISEIGLTVSDVLSVIRSYSGGRSMRNLMLIKDDRVKYDVKFAGYDDFQVNDFNNLSLLDKTGKPINMKDLVNIQRVRTLASITREKQQYSRYVTFDFLGPYDYAREYIDAVAKTVNLPYGYSIETGFKWSFGEEEKIAFAKMIFAAIILIFMVCASLYESFKKPLIIIFSIPMALIGLFLIFYFTDTNFGRSGYAGLILLMGVAVNNAIVLIDYISKLINRGFPIDEAICEGTIRRSKPIIMTTLTTIIGLLPFIIIGEQTSLWYGLSMSVIGGLISSTIMVLFLLPVMFRVFVSKSIVRH